MTVLFLVRQMGLLFSHQARLLALCVAQTALFEKPAAQNADTTAFCPPQALWPRLKVPLNCWPKRKAAIQMDSCFPFWCGRWDLNPYARAHAPQTCLSANSSTAAHHVIIAADRFIVNSFSRKFERKNTEYDSYKTNS